MKKLKTLALVFITISMFSCGEPLRQGEIVKVNQNDSIDIFEYCYDENRQCNHS
jgi:hypothetical protein